MSWARGPGWAILLGIVGWGLPFGALTASRDVAREGATPLQVLVSVLIGVAGGVLFGILMHWATTDSSRPGRRARTGWPGSRASGSRPSNRVVAVAVLVALVFVMYLACFLLHGLPLSQRPSWMPWWLLGQFLVNIALLLLLVRAGSRAPIPGGEPSPGSSATEGADRPDDR